MRFENLFCSIFVSFMVLIFGSYCGDIFNLFLFESFYCIYFQSVVLFDVILCWDEILILLVGIIVEKKE